MEQATRWYSVAGDEVGPIACGGSYFDADQFDGEKRAELRRTMEAALESGVNHFDTAAGYGGGASERLLGEFFAGKRDQVFLATKADVDEMDSTRMEREVDESLSRLGTDTIDLFYIHWPRQGKDPRPLMEGLRSAKEKGKIRAIGVSSFSVEQISQVREVAPLDAHQTGYNLFWRKPEEAIIPYCRKNGIPVVTYSSIAQGIMTGKFPRDLSFSRDDPRTGIVFFRDDVWPHIHSAVDELKLLAAESGRSLVELGIRWVLSHDGITTAVVGARNEAQLRANVASLEGEIGEEVFRRMTEVSDRVQPLFPTCTTTCRDGCRYWLPARPLSHEETRIPRARDPRHDRRLPKRPSKRKRKVACPLSSSILCGVSRCWGLEERHLEGQRNHPGGKGSGYRGVFLAPDAYSTAAARP